ncbi:hypothetical protein OOT00_10820 [Desulfobotulus sp. H1]|uniref:Protochlamydia outer membrane protein domain-containing protein n=1 Tax=Desulfobotulus pelophilus TaxID=2823377 RepID=A0ABT3NAJ0_9BACT|nr:hypothetical protein [Desulfobotulus pelophilus]MCW7754477.1 hypothetical protein [Desulfobotulus pelophilus]
MKQGIPGHKAIYLLLSLFLAAGGFAWAEPELPYNTEPPALSMQMHLRDNNQARLSPHWSQADQAMHMANTQNASQGVDLRLSMDRLHFKSSIQQERLHDDIPYTGQNTSYARGTDRMDMAAGIGYQWDLLNQRLSLIPMMGLSYHGYSPDSRNPQYGNTGGDALQPAKGELSEWNSWWYGLDLRAQPRPDLSVESSLLFHNAKFSERNPEWGDISDNNPHKSEGEGRIFRLGVRQQLSPSWSAGILYSWQQWMSERGDLPADLSPQDRGRSDIPFNGDIQELNISLSYGF